MSKTSIPSTPSVGFVSLGCPKALVDSEQIITRLRAEGYDIAASYQDANLVIVNTCGFIDDAVKESLDAIADALTQNGKVIVTGCLGAKGQVVQDTHPSVLAITGPHAADEVLHHVHRHLPKPHDPFTDLVPAAGIKLTPKHYAYLKISEGCNHRCTFCIIPSLRGDLVSRPIHEVLTEAENLAKSGTKELLIVSQDTSAYGIDTKYKMGFYQGRPVKTRMQELCEELGNMDLWVRLHYVYPYPHVDHTIELMADGKILPYLDIPFQHASHNILKAMQRPASSEKVLERIQKWRNTCPDIAIRSTFIVGFPGETEADFEELLSFIQEAKINRAGAFAYSNVDGATAQALANHVPEEVKQDRLERFMAMQEHVSASLLAAKVGQVMPVIVDEVVPEGAVCRTKYDAPEIDGQVFVDEHKNAKVGDIIQVKIIDSDEHDLWGMAV